ncbi:MAG: hypothetical protein C4K58_03080 [Flavobacteriaceae bacterium]|nr:MAG: hypothetical protein C4K58_03080 [Flavobacteriaceae bacterium]
MKVFLFALMIFVGSIFSLAQTPTFDATLKKAGQENKKVLLYFSGSDWCAPCIKFKNTYINSAEFKDFSKNNLLLFNADFPRSKANQLSKEKTKENEALADKYNPSGNFPMILLLNSKGQVVKKWGGLPKEKVADFVKLLK